MPTSRELFPLPADLLTNPSLPTRLSSTRHRRSTALQKVAEEEWTRATLNSLNTLYGCKSSDACQLTPSAAQVATADHVRGCIHDAGAPSQSPAAALYELCGTAPGYAFEPASRAHFGESRVALPSRKSLCNPERVLEGDDRDLWLNWEDRLLRAQPRPRRQCTSVS